MLLARFLQNQKGGVAPMLALAIIPLIGMVGAAVDYSRASSTRTAMQAALDSTALMLSKDAQSLTAAQLDSKASAYFNALFHRPEASNVQVTPQFSTPQQGSFNIKVTGSATISTMFWRLVGQDQVNITASGEVVWGIKKLNLALALDNTGSMASSNKMTELKKAAHGLLDTLKKAEKTPGDIKISIIPFAVDVNVGTDKRRRVLDRLGGLGRQERNLQQVLVHIPRAAAINNNGTWTPANHSTWNGCVMDRDQNNDVNATATG